jgi:hypothetical protein
VLDIGFQKLILQKKPLSRCRPQIFFTQLPGALFRILAALILKEADHGKAALFVLILTGALEATKSKIHVTGKPAGE